MDKPVIYNKFSPKYPEMIQLYSLNTPNGIKVGVALEEMEIAYEPHVVNIRTGEQFTEEFKTVNPNSKIPAILDPNGPGGEAVSLMESGAILWYLAEKSGKFLPKEPVKKLECIQWMFFQVGHIGPMFGQFGHFYKFAKDKCKDPYPIERYTVETQRLLGVLEERLKISDYILNEYSIADMMIFPWVRALKVSYLAEEVLKLNDFPIVFSWLEKCLARPAVQKGLTVCSLN